MDHVRGHRHQRVSDPRRGCCWVKLARSAITLPARHCRPMSPRTSTGSHWSRGHRRLLPSKATPSPRNRSPESSLAPVKGPESRAYQEREVSNVLDALQEITDQVMQGTSPTITKDLICAFNRRLLDGTEHEPDAVPGGTGPRRRRRRLPGRSSRGLRTCSSVSQSGWRATRSSPKTGTSGSRWQWPAPSTPTCTWPGCTPSATATVALRDCSSSLILARSGLGPCPLHTSCRTTTTSREISTTANSRASRSHTTVSFLTTRFRASWTACESRSTKFVRSNSKLLGSPTSTR